MMFLLSNLVVRGSDLSVCTRSKEERVVNDKRANEKERLLPLILLLSARQDGQKTSTYHHHLRGTTDASIRR